MLSRSLFGMHQCRYISFTALLIREVINSSTSCEFDSAAVDNQDPTSDPQQPTTHPQHPATDPQ